MTNLHILSYTELSSPCTTPDYKSGNCIDVRNCEVFRNILFNPPISRNDAEKLRSHLCGREGNIRKVRLLNVVSAQNT